MTHFGNRSNAFYVGTNMDEALGTKMTLTELLDFHARIHGESTHFKQLGWPDLSEVKKLRAIAGKLDSELEKLRKQPDSPERAERATQAYNETRLGIRAWREEVKKSYRPRLDLARKDLQEAIDKRLSKGAGPAREFLWRQLEKIGDPLKLRELYRTGDDELRGAIASMPRLVFQSDSGPKFDHVIDREQVFQSESERYPDLQRTLDVLESMRSSLDGLGVIVESGLAEV
jgi:hypothetical protein